MHKLRTAEPPKRKTYPIEGLEGCTLTVRQPEFFELIEQWFESRDTDGKTNESKLMAYRFRAVCDWDGFATEDGGPLMFSTEWLMRAMRQNQRIMMTAITASNEAFRGMGVEDEKNFDAPSVNGSTAPAATIGE